MSEQTLDHRLSRRGFLRSGGIVIFSAGAGCIQSVDDNGTNRESIEREELTKEITLVEESLFDQSKRTVRSMVHRGERIYAAGMQDTDAARGAGYGLELWTKRGADEDWERNQLLEPDKITLSMTNVFGGQDPSDPVFVSYSARGAYRGGAHIMRVEPSGDSAELFVYDESGDSFLNTQGVHTPEEDRIDFFVPDRGSPNNIRWFQLDPVTGDVLSRTNIEHSGFESPRMYDTTVRDDGRIVFPVGNAHEMDLVAADPANQDYEVSLVEEYRNIGERSDTARSFRLLEYPDKELYVLTGLLPADFSNRSNKGLVGEVVARSVDMYDLESIDREVIGGFNAENAATHYTEGARISSDAFAQAYTTVTGEHVFHLSEEHDNYVEGIVTVWEVSDNGTFSVQAEQQTDPFWMPNLTSTNNGMFHVVATEATSRNAIWYQQWEINKHLGPV